MLKIPVFYYRSTIILVDDDLLFLEATKQLFQSKYITKSFYNPISCINYLENYTAPLSTISFLRGCQEHEYYATSNHSIVDLDVPKLRLLHDHPELDDEISVVIVDYNMPDMNGIEFCKKIQMLPIKKILLTGEADQQEAINAFNNNVIDRFIRKDSKNLVNEIHAYVKDLTQQYFQERSSVLLSHLEADSLMPLSDPSFISFFNKFCVDHFIKKHILIDKNGSLLLTDENNCSSFFVIHTDSSLNTFIELHDDVSEIETFLTDVKNRNKIPFFGVGKQGWEFEPKDWQSNFYEPKILEGRVRYYYSTVKI